MSVSTEFILTDGQRAGNTETGLKWLENEIRYGGPGGYLVATTTNAHLRIATLPAFLQRFFRDLDLGTWHRGEQRFTFDRQYAAIYFSDRRFLRDETWVQFIAGTNPDHIRGLNFKAAVVVDGGRAFPVSMLTLIRDRLATFGGRALLVDDLDGT